MIRAFFILLSISLGAAVYAETKIPESPSEIQLGFAPLVREAAPAVVNIYAKRVVQTRQSPFQGDPFFQNLFRDFGESRPRVQNSLGSGVILTGDGIIVSNFHVVGMATDIRVVLNDRREFSAKVLLADRASDLAILKLEETGADMPFLRLRDSDTVEVGELVLAIGNPFGVGQTVSSGIVSGLARTGTAAGSGQGYFLQTDAPINPGNSGGALIDVNGKLIGINTRILTRSGGSNGIGFAIPSKLVAEFVAQAKNGNETFLRPWAGASGQLMDADMAESFGLLRPEGIVISELHDKSPLKSAGVSPGDVILAVDGMPVNNGAEMMFRMSIAGLGNKAVLSVLQDDVIREIPVVLQTAQEKPARATQTTTERSALPGIVVSRINPAVIAQYRLPLRAEGIIVEATGDLGARAGLRQADILVGIDRYKIETPADVEGALRAASGWTSLIVLRGDRQVTLRFRL